MTYDPPMIEAASLSAITELAASPPLHAQAPVPPPGRPLTLYIARVPGSRDVFLTPMKPRDRIVTAEDIQSSLYYVHVSSAADHDADYFENNAEGSWAGSLGGIEEKREFVVERRPVGNETGLKRKPVDATVGSAVKKSPLITRKPVLSQASVHGGATNYPTPDSSPHPSPRPLSQNMDLPEIPRRRPLPQTKHMSLHEDNVRLLRHSEHIDENNNPYFRSYTQTPVSTLPTWNGAHGDDDNDGALTLIRRDPGSSEQWNVASIHDPPVQDVSSAALLSPPTARLTKKGGAPLYLDITNPGYSQFIRDNRPGSRNSTSTSSSESSVLPEGTFRRRLYMPGSRFGEHGYGHRKQKSVDSVSSAERQRIMHAEALAQLSGDRPPTTDRRTKGYAFDSPWGGKCEFSTGATGKSLKCRHTCLDRGTTDVSELRFNLPTTTRNSKVMTVGEKRSSYFAHLRHSRRDFDYEEDIPSHVINEDGRVDLTLGQERAGGGFRGRQAKLGKLIIEPEGLKMLDLLVAANVGLWWRAYEKI